MLFLGAGIQDSLQGKTAYFEKMIIPFLCKGKGVLFVSTIKMLRIDLIWCMIAMNIQLA